ncbi:MerR family transcriptional regulator [Tranquillimonas alkanivorans]|uniref:MerR HTH family regulatory protein n=1 Tax=Tranquillimonas alkanivorans TaxID=441119 RepID=A0A1I5L1Q2_9RHOB|nr:hypothetical protein [Tranquillimonas alkanivorans]SFO91207.1 hypothetical protein SAMN04488047_101417 [Tranquillimonas alkanivorans]
MKMDEFKDTIGASRREIENWLNRVDPFLSTFEPTRRGIPREYTKENVIELAFIAAFIRAGLELQSASAYARTMLRHYRNKEVRAWVAFPAGDAASSKATDDISGTDFAALAARSDRSAVTVIHVSAVFEKIERLFARAA